MKRVISGQHLTIADRLGPPSPIRHKAARFPYQQATRRRIPRLEVAFPESFIPTRGNPSEIERGRSKTADPGSPGADSLINPAPFDHITCTGKGNTGCNQGLVEMTATGYPQTRVLQPCPPGLFSPEAFIGDRLVDEPRRNFSPTAAIKLGFLNRDGDGEMRDSVEEIAGAVEGVDDPTRFAGIAFHLAAFFEQKPPVGASLPEIVIKAAFGRSIGLGYKIRRPLSADLQVLDLSEIPAQSTASAAGGTLHHTQKS